MKKFNQLAKKKKKLLKIFLSSIKTKVPVGIKFPKKKKKLKKKILPKIVLALKGSEDLYPKKKTDFMKVLSWKLYSAHCHKFSLFE